MQFCYRKIHVELVVNWDRRSMFPVVDHSINVLRFFSYHSKNGLWICQRSLICLLIKNLQEFLQMLYSSRQLKEEFVSRQYNVCFSGRYLEKNGKVTPIQHTKPYLLVLCASLTLISFYSDNSYITVEELTMTSGYGWSRYINKHLWAFNRGWCFSSD